MGKCSQPFIPVYPFPLPLMIITRFKGSAASFSIRFESVLHQAWSPEDYQKTALKYRHSLGISRRFLELKVYVFGFLNNVFISSFLANRSLFFRLLSFKSFHKKLNPMMDIISLQGVLHNLHMFLSLCSRCHRSRLDAWLLPID